MKRYKAKCEMENGKLVTLTFKANNKNEVKDKVINNYNVKYIMSIDEIVKGKQQEKIEFYTGMNRTAYPYIKNNNGKSVKIFT